MIAVVGCVPNQQYRTVDSLDPAKAVIESTDEYKLGFVEFDDQGWFWDRSQLTKVQDMIRTEAGIDHEPHTPQGVIILVFVHGWKHNAESNDGNVDAMRSVLSQLSEAEKAQKDHAPRKVVGVYVGWRGLAEEVEPFEELSFWGRKETAHRVGGYGGLTELLVDLELLQKQSIGSHPPSRTELIIIGHSFGGAALYSALGQIITERFLFTVGQKKNRRLKPLGDQVILLNPAFEAARYYDLDQMVRAFPNYSDDQRPVLSIFTSKTDWATHYAFPFGRTLSSLSDSFSSDKQKQASLQAVGWYKDFITHHLDYNENASFPVTENPVTKTVRPSLDQEFLLKSHENIKTRRDEWLAENGPSQDYPFDKTVLRPVKGFPARDPFLIVSVDRRVMDGHSDITNPVLLNFLREYIQFCQKDPKDLTD
jgi:hypothetical protein